MRRRHPVPALPHLAVVLALATGALPAQGVVTRQVAAMGTWLTVHVEAPSRPVALAASEAACVAVQAVELRLSTWRSDSELARANAAPVGAVVTLSAATAADLALAGALRERTGGAFEPVLGALLDAYGLPAVPRWPTAGELAAARAACGRDAITWTGGALVRHHPRAWVASDAFAKGVALERAAAAARTAGAGVLRLDFGGQWLVRGAGHTLDLAHPQQRDRHVATLSLAPGGSAATSGDGERTVVVDGRPLGHLFDARTGLPVATGGSVTVVATDAALADAASTALFVLGRERGLALADRLGVEAVFVEVHGEAVRLHTTWGLRELLRSPHAIECPAPTRQP